MRLRCPHFFFLAACALTGTTALGAAVPPQTLRVDYFHTCLLYTSDAADE